MSDESIAFMSAVEMAAAIRKKKLSAVEVVKAFVNRIAQINPSLNAYVTQCIERAMDDARRADSELMHGADVGPLHGIPFSVKDLVFTSGLRTTGGSRIHKDFVPAEDAPAVARLRRAGAILLGKTNTPEFGYKATTENPLFGVTRNPWDRARTPGGSSGGAAAATAAGLSPLSIGTDGGGSIRIPASFCGVFGFKPTFGLVPSGRGFRGWRTLAHTGPITRTVRDAALMLDLMAGPDERDRFSIPSNPGGYNRTSARGKKRVRVGYSKDLHFAVVEQEIASIVHGAVARLEGVGFDVEESELDLSEAPNLFERIVAGENAAAHQEDIRDHREIMDEALVKFVERSLGQTALDYLGADQGRERLTAQLAECFSRFDFLLTPTVAVAPFPIGEPPREIEGTKISPLGWIPFTYPFNLTGNPAASIPCGMTSSGLPVGLQVVGSRHSDAKVLAFCERYESEFPWSDRNP